MRFSQATVLAFAALSLAAPAFEADNKNIKREDCDKTSFHGHHKHKRAVAYDYAYVTVTVDGKGNPITTVSPVLSIETIAKSEETSSTSTSISSTTTIVQNDSLTSDEPKTLSLSLIHI